MGKSNPVRIVVLGTGTNVGKTWLGCALLDRLRARGRLGIGLKPVESGVSEAMPSDGSLLAAPAAREPAPAPYRFHDPVSPHLAARRAGTSVELSQILTYVQIHESGWLSAAPEVTVVETAGGLLTPLAPGLTNFDFARALDPARWLLVAPDALGVLHDLSATLGVCRALGRTPDAVALCRARPLDASTGTNAEELARLGITASPFVFPGNANADAELDRLLDALLP